MRAWGPRAERLMEPRRTPLQQRIAHALLAVLWAAPVVPAVALAEDPADTFVLGNLQFLLVHEFAHLVIGELQVPVLGPEENAADYLAATALIRADRRDARGSERNQSYLLAAAEAQRLSWQKGKSLGAPVPYWDAHALTIQRFYQIACLLHGSDPAAYADLPARIGMPPGRAAGCRAEFERASRALDWLLATYGRKPGEPPGAVIEVRYEEAASLASQRVVALMKGERLAETVAARVSELFRLPRPAAVVMRRCGRAEAAWQPARRELTLCYELADALWRMAPRS